MTNYKDSHKDTYKNSNVPLLLSLLSGVGTVSHGRFFVVFCSILQYIVLISAFGGWLVCLHVLARFGIFSHITTYNHIKLAFFYRLTLFTFCGVVWRSGCWWFGVCVCQKLPPLDTYFLKINSLRVVTIFFLL